MDVQSQSSLRQSTRPKRYNDEVYDDDESYTPGRNGRGASGFNGDGIDGDGYVSDEEGDGLLRATAHIWREPLQAYILDLHARRRQVEQDVEDAEASRKFVVAARAVEMSEKRIPAMRERREVRLVELEREDEVRARQEAEALQRATVDEEKRARKEVDKEERLRKQREAARKKREEDRQKREHDNEQRRLRAEEARIAKLAEAERKANLTPEQREAEDRALAEKLAREREEAAARMREQEEELLTSGRGARKRKRVGDTGDLEEEAAQALSSIGMYAEYDDLDEDGSDLYEVAGAKGRKGKAGSRRSSSYAPEGLPPGAYIGPDGQQYDATGQPLAASRHLSPQPASDFLDDDAEGDMVKPKKPRQPIDELERKVWQQIARRDIPKARLPLRSHSKSSADPTLLLQVVKVAQQSTTSRQFFCKRLSSIVSREARRAATRTKPTKDVQTRAKKVMRELMMFMKGNEKREREQRKKAEKEALEKARKEEEVREAKRQARKLNFLITQTELYSHFVGNKIKSACCLLRSSTPQC